MVKAKPVLLLFEAVQLVCKLVLQGLACTGLKTEMDISQSSELSRTSAWFVLFPGKMLSNPRSMHFPNETSYDVELISQRALFVKNSCICSLDNGLLITASRGGNLISHDRRQTQPCAVFRRRTWWPKWQGMVYILCCSNGSVHSFLLWPSTWHDDESCRSCGSISCWRVWSIRFTFLVIGHGKVYLWHRRSRAGHWPQHLTSRSRWIPKWRRRIALILIDSGPKPEKQDLFYRFVSGFLDCARIHDGDQESKWVLISNLHFENKHHAIKNGDQFWKFWLQVSFRFQIR